MANSNADIVTAAIRSLFVVHNCFTRLITTFYTIKTWVWRVHNLIWAIKSVFVLIKCLLHFKFKHLNNNWRVLWKKCNRFGFVHYYLSKKRKYNIKYIKKCIPTFVTLSAWTKTMENEFNSILFSRLVNCDIVLCRSFRLKLILLWYLFNRNEKRKQFNQCFFFRPKAHEPHRKKTTKK